MHGVVALIGHCCLPYLPLVAAYLSLLHCVCLHLVDAFRVWLPTSPAFPAPAWLWWMCSLTHEFLLTGLLLLVDSLAAGDDSEALVE